jgi:hypothetical protein
MNWQLSGPALPLLLHNLLNGSDYSGLECLQPLVTRLLPNKQTGQHAQRKEFNAGHALRASLPSMFPEIWIPEHALVFDEYEEVLHAFCTPDRGAADGSNVLTRFATRMSDRWEDRLAETGLSDSVLSTGSAHVTVHVMRLMVAMEYQDLLEADTKYEQALIHLTLFLDNHLLSVRFLNMYNFSDKDVGAADADISASVDWVRVDPVPLRGPWWGSLPDLSPQMLMYASFARPRMPSTRTFEVQLTSTFVSKQTPHACSPRNITEVLVQILQQNRHSFALALDITLIALLGNYPGAGSRLPFCLRSSLAAAFLSITMAPAMEQCVWIQMHLRLVYFCLKVYVEFLYLKTPTLRTMLFTDYSLSTHSQIVQNTLVRVRAVLAEMPTDDLRGGRFDALVRTMDEDVTEGYTALEFLGNQVRDTWQQAETLCEKLHVVTTSCHMRRTRGPFAYILGITMYRLMNAIDWTMAVEGRFEAQQAKVKELIESRVGRSSWPAPLNHFYATFPTMEPPPPEFRKLKMVNDRHPVLTLDELSAARTLARFIVTRPTTWPYLEMLLAIGVPEPFVNMLQVLFMSYNASMTDNMFRRTVACAFFHNPKAFILVEAVYWHVMQLLQVVIFPLPEHHARAQIEAVRRRDGTLPTAPGHGQYTSMFVYCRGCMYIFSDIANPEGERQIGSQSFGLRPGESTCRFDPVLGYHVCRRTSHPGCQGPVVMINMIGSGILFRRRVEYRLCSRCGRITQYHHVRDTTYGIVCHCEETAAPTAPVPLPRLEQTAHGIEAEFTLWAHARAPQPHRVTQRPFCCICKTPLAVNGIGAVSGQRIMVYDSDPASLVHHPATRPEWVCPAHIRTVTFYCTQNKMHISNVLPLRDIIRSHERFTKSMANKGVLIN